MKGKQGSDTNTTVDTSTSTTILSSTNSSTIQSFSTTASSTSSTFAPGNVQKVDLALDPEKEEERMAKFRMLRQRYHDMYGDLDMEKAYQNLFEILWYSQLPCFDVKNITSENMDELSMVKRCYWKGKKMSCASIFSTRPTDRGMCCSFNMKKADEIFKKSQYASALLKMQKQDTELNFEGTELPVWFQENKEPRSQPGQEKGLRLVLDAHSDRVSSSTVYENFRGFVTTVDGRDKYPLTSKSSFLVRPGKENFAIISAVQATASEDIRSIEPVKRQCYFKTENPLEIHNKYSRSNCMLECSLNYTRRMMGKLNEANVDGCIPWFYPVTDDHYTNVCDPWDTRTFQKMMSTVPDSECAKCLPDCTDTMYEVRVSTAPFRYCDHTNLGASALCDLENIEMNPPIWIKTVGDEFEGEKLDIPDYVKPNPLKLSNIRRAVGSPNMLNDLTLLQKYNKSKKYDAFEKDIAIVNFYYDQSNVVKFKKTQRITMTGFISQIGGLLGLSIGLSFISVMEIFYFLTFRLCMNFSNAQKARSMKSKASTKADNDIGHTIRDI